MKLVKPRFHFLLIYSYFSKNKLFPLASVVLNASLFFGLKNGLSLQVICRKSGCHIYIKQSFECQHKQRSGRKLAKVRFLSNSQALNEWFQTVGCQRTPGAACSIQLPWLPSRRALLESPMISPGNLCFNKASRIPIQELYGLGFEMCCSDHSKDVQYFSQKSSKTTLW